MMKKIIAGMLVSATVVSANAASLEDRVSELEAQQSLNILSFSGSFWNRYDAISDTSSSTSDSTMNPGGNSKANWMRMGFNFDINANVNKRTKFYSRYSMYKNYNNWSAVNDNGNVTSDFSRNFTQNPGADSGVFVEKAYLDYTMSDWAILSIGRLPTVDGPPTQFWNSAARMGTYPMMSYNSILDGAALTFKFDQWMPADHKLAFRLIDTPFSANSGSPYTGAASGSSTNPMKIDSLNDIPTMQLDYSVNNLKWADSVNFIAQTWTGSFMMPNSTFQKTANQYSAGLSKLFSYVAAGTNAYLDFSNSYNDITLKATVSTLNLEVDNLAGWGTDFNVNYVMSNSSTNGSLKNVVVQNSSTTHSSTSGLASTAGAIASGAAGNTLKGALAQAGINSSGVISDTGSGYGGKDGSSVSGNMMMVSLRQKFMSKNYLGVEYVKGSKDFFYFNGAAEDLTQFYLTPGTGTHVYLTRKLEDNLSIRVGYMQQKYEFTPVGIGERSTSDETTNTTYATLRLDF